MTSIPNVLTIAGSDSGGGAGIQADIKAISANGAYAASVITALTAQNTQGVTAIHDVSPDFVTAQIDAVFSDIRIAAVKIGMLSKPEVIEAVAEGIKRWKPAHIVLDPVMVAASGAPLIDDAAVDTLRQHLFPLATLVTPNLHEAARLTGEHPAETDEAMRHQAAELIGQGARAVLIKGGHGHGVVSRDLLLGAGEPEWFEALRIDTDNNHGTGCSLSSAIAAHLAMGKDLPHAITAAKTWLTGALATADNLDVGQGHGPVHHFHALWTEQGNA